MTAREVIRKKRDGGVLTKEEIAYFIRGYMTSEITDYHVSAFLMAVYFRGMELQETLELTRAMRDSGQVLDLLSIPGRKVDKHSTGGVGDKTSLIVAPIAAACGATVPMITGRALGHSGGTLDKLESIPGFNAQPSPQKIVSILRQSGAVIMGQTEDLAPADRRIYALRDVTATVESVPLITASILSKKLAEGIDGLVMDVKTGAGAFTPTLEESKALARSIVEVCRKMRTRVVVLITDMDQPLGRAIGNAIEVQECIELLKGKGPQDLKDISITLAAHMIHLSGRVRTIEAARSRAAEVLANGEAANSFRAIVRNQGGDDRVMDDTRLFPRATHTKVFTAKNGGFVTHCNARLLGLAANALGAGRNRVEDRIDPAAGIYLEKKIGDRVQRGDALCILHWSDQDRLWAALKLIRQAYEIKPRPAKPRPLIYAVLNG
jgi:pyrimidine-nucleoside phosphorylase